MEMGSSLKLHDSNGIPDKCNGGESFTMAKGRLGRKMSYFHILHIDCPWCPVIRNVWPDILHNVEVIKDLEPMIAAFQSRLSLFHEASVTLSTRSLGLQQTGHNVSILYFILFCLA